MACWVFLSPDLVHFNKYFLSSGKCGDLGWERRLRDTDKELLPSGSLASSRTAEGNKYTVAFFRHGKNDANKSRAVGGTQQLLGLPERGKQCFTCLAASNRWLCCMGTLTPAPRVSTGGREILLPKRESCGRSLAGIFLHTRSPLVPSQEGVMLILQ